MIYKEKINKLGDQHKIEIYIEHKLLLLEDQIIIKLNIIIFNKEYNVYRMIIN